jgi:hypothetical protein
VSYQKQKPQRSFFPIYENAHIPFSLVNRPVGFGIVECGAARSR